MNELSRRYLYIDETGTPYLNDSRCDFFILVGICIDGFSNAQSLCYLDDILSKYNIDYNQGFHVVDLFEPIKNKKGELHSAYIKDDEIAKNLVVDLANFIRIFPLKINAYLIKKQDFAEKLGITKTKLDNFQVSKYTLKELYFLPYTYAITRLIHDFAIENKKVEEEKFGSIIFETRSGNELIVKNLDRINNYLSFDDEIIRESAKKTKENIVSIEFSNKKACYPGLALADIIGFVLHQKYADKITKFENRGLKELLIVIDKKISPIDTNQPEINKYLTKETLNKISKI